MYRGGKHLAEAPARESLGILIIAWRPLSFFLFALLCSDENTNFAHCDSTLRLEVYTRCRGRRVFSRTSSPRRRPPSRYRISHRITGVSANCYRRRQSQPMTSSLVRIDPDQPFTTRANLPQRALNSKRPVRNGARGTLPNPCASSCAPFPITTRGYKNTPPPLI